MSAVNDADYSPNNEDSLKEKIVSNDGNWFSIRNLIIADGAIVIIAVTVTAISIIRRNRQRKKQKEHGLLQNKSSPTKGIEASVIDQVLGQSMLLPMGDTSVTSSDNDDVSSYYGSVSELLFDVYAPPGNWE